MKTFNWKLADMKLLNKIWIQQSKYISLFILIVFHQQIFAQTPSAEKILYNGKIFTASSPTTAEAISIKDDKIIAVGNLSTVKASVSDKAQWIDLQGKCLLPGLIDSHNHALSGGESLMSATTNDELLTKEELLKFAQQTLESKKGMRGDVLYIRGMHSGTWAAVNELNEIFNSGTYEKQGVVLHGSDGHTSWVNNVMLHRASVDAVFIRSLSPADQKYFGFNEKFEPNGLISEDGKKKIWAILPPGNIDPYEAGVVGVKHLNSLGITAWLDPSAGNISEGESNSKLRVYKALSQQSTLTAHVATVVVGEANGDPASQVSMVRKLQNQFQRIKNVNIIGFKIFADGVLEFPTQTAAISIPYLNSGERGSLMFDPEKFKNFVVTADKEKLLVHVHAIGDRAVTETLNAFSFARNTNSNSNLSHSITHLQLIKPEDFKRFSALNVLLSMQLLWASADIYTIDLVKPYIDPSLFAHQYPAMSLVKAGTIIGGASDWPVSSANPFDAIAMAEMRTGKDGVLHAEEIMNRVEMLKAYTIHAAKIMLSEKQIGSIEPGKQADFVAA